MTQASAQGGEQTGRRANVSPWWRLAGAVPLRVLKPRLIATFFGVVATGILIVGYLFNILL